MKNIIDRMKSVFVGAGNSSNAIRVAGEVAVTNISDTPKDVDITKVGGASVPTKGTQKVVPAAVYNSLGEQVSSFGGIAYDAQDITRNDTTEYTNVVGFKALADGNITVVTANNQSRLLAVQEGAMEPVSIKKFMLTGSDNITIRIYTL